MKKLLIALILFQTWLNSAGAVTPSAYVLITNETKGNATLARSKHQVDIPHFEIPVEFVEADFAERFSPAIRQQLFFERQGKKYYRWILNPEDTEYHKELSDHFAKLHGLQLTKQNYFKGYPTASRSYIVEDPEGRVQFSVKGSTNVLEKKEVLKKQRVDEATDSRLNADFLHDLQTERPFEYVIVMDEPAVLKIRQVDQALIIRDLGELNNPQSDKIYLPGFSVLHSKIGTDIATRNGSTNPYEFWTEHYIRSVGRAMGEFAARTGIQFDSPHSQNFLVEFDRNLKPTGRIVLRDLADLVVYRAMMNVLHRDPEMYFKKFSQTRNIRPEIFAAFGPLQGTVAPTWLDGEGYGKWPETFFAEFDRSFMKTSALWPGQIQAEEIDYFKQYFFRKYKLTGSIYLQLLSAARNMRSQQNQCSRIFSF